MDNIKVCKLSLQTHRQTQTLHIHTKHFDMKILQRMANYLNAWELLLMLAVVLILAIYTLNLRGSY